MTRGFTQISFKLSYYHSANNGLFEADWVKLTLSPFLPRRPGTAITRCRGRSGGFSQDYDGGGIRARLEWNGGGMMLYRANGLPMGLLYGPSSYGIVHPSRLDIHLDDLSLFGKPVVLRFENSGNIGPGYAPTEQEWELAGWLVAIFPQMSPWISSLLAENGMDGRPSRMDRLAEARIVINRAWSSRQGAERWSLVLVGLDGVHEQVIDFSGSLLLERRHYQSGETWAAE